MLVFYVCFVFIMEILGMRGATAAIVNDVLPFKYSNDVGDFELKWGFVDGDVEIEFT